MSCLTINFTNKSNSLTGKSATKPVIYQLTLSKCVIGVRTKLNVIDLTPILNISR